MELFVLKDTIYKKLEFEEGGEADYYTDGVDIEALKGKVFKFNDKNHEFITDIEGSIIVSGVTEEFKFEAEDVYCNQAFKRVIKPCQTSINGQGINYEEILQLYSGHKIKIKIRSDSTHCQCYAKVFVFNSNNNEWNLLDEIPYSRMETKHGLHYEPRNIGLGLHYYSDDAENLLIMANNILVDIEDLMK